jgi:hypothetical protein
MASTLLLFFPLIVTGEKLISLCPLPTHDQPLSFSVQSWDSPNRSSPSATLNCTPRITVSNLIDTLMQRSSKFTTTELISSPQSLSTQLPIRFKDERNYLPSLPRFTDMVAIVLHNHEIEAEIEQSPFLNSAEYETLIQFAPTRMLLQPDKELLKFLVSLSDNLTGINFGGADAKFGWIAI